MTNKIRSTAGLIAGVLALTLVVMVGSAVGGGIIGQFKREAAIVEAGNSAFEKTQEQIYRNVCPDYLEANFVKKQFVLRDLAWCENYAGRF